MTSTSCMSNNEEIMSKNPSEVLSFLNEWKITLGSGMTVKDLNNYQHQDYFYTISKSEDWVVYKTPNSGGTTPNSSNTRSELRHNTEWIPEQGGRLTGTLKVQHVSLSGDARIPASFSVIVGQIHSAEGHKNEPLKIFYKKYPGHKRGSIFWNYEINTSGSNKKRWDVATPVWGYDWSVLGEDPDSYPAEPTEGIELGEEFSYTVDVKKGVMYLTFECEGHKTKTFTKNLIQSEYSNKEDIPKQVIKLFSQTHQDGVERNSAYSGEFQYFKQGAYNQTNGKDPETHWVWSTGSETYGGDVELQYKHGSYTEVWFKSATVEIYP